MIKVLKARYKFYLILFAVGFLFVIIPSRQLKESILVGVFMALFLGNGVYYMLMEKESYFSAFFRSLKYFAVMTVLVIIYSIITNEP